MSGLIVAVWLCAVDGGTPPASKVVDAPKSQLSAEDLEMLKHLDVLEAFDEAKDLDMLEELSVER